jgi:hypothetical protein
MSVTEINATIVKKYITPQSELNFEVYSATTHFFARVSITWKGRPNAEEGGPNVVGVESV